MGSWHAFRITREAQHLAVLGVVDNALVLTMLRYADELVDVDRLAFPRAKEVRPKELELAKMLVKTLETEWKPDKYSDDYQAKLMRVIHDKLKGREPDVIAVTEPQRTAVVDLMQRLRQSLEGGSKRKATRPAAHRRTKRARRSAA